ncbi:G-type lectin S-receptor-like serine/threonine-protein kinase At4g27290 isoform X1 [Salvia miltiorrhiza]|uniref:G-type lectin S-receptor-like serine/threonine-protein kinase At4g27290 isoform X1 n=1 Tax=Salvia miltiorrhiza TaxID=226208 RepID=UPI0025AC9EE8|nr:G-type lectin S-receptor-like serine/threonine-protein kinase At4g27290 isoform X1 [Salvia miltiorrhiza]
MIERRNKIVLSILISSLIISAANDTINKSESIRDGETLVSSGGMFALGFFSLANSTNRYVGIWYNHIKPNTYVWLANREAPLTTKSGALTLTDSGFLLLLDETNATVWSSSTTATTPQNPAVQLLDSGNLVVKDAENLLWQSFDHPTDTYLPGMMSLGWNLDTRVETYLSSWKSHDDPSSGDFTAHLDPTGYPQIIVRRGKTVKFRLGPWNGVRFSGSPGTRNNPTLNMNKNEVKYGEDNVDGSVIARLTLSLEGVGVRWIWNDQSKSWMTYNLEADACDNYNACGAYGVCSVGDSPICRCMDRFVHRDEGNLSLGCVARTALACEGDVFFKYSGMKLPDARNTTFDDRKMLPADCEAECLKNCSCTAYKQLDIREETSGCLFYYGELFDARTMAVGGDELYIRIASADLEKDAESKRRKRVKLVASLASMAATVLICLVLILICVWKRKKDSNPYKEGQYSGSLGQEADLPFFSLPLILKATDNFSIDNKLGEGGFGPVYKGVLENGQEIAVKRLSKTSKQGVDELKNEVILIAKLQHRNLVRTLGCCADGEESMLIYEYMPNKSLDFILFDETKSMLLDWKKRFNIITGIAKGLLYLHQDSRLRIIHRDLKASNILLDAEMNPKISDFGLARSFGGNETQAQTSRVVGTYGYMSPEYAIDGMFSIKSDVFSFGVLVLEIVSGKRNRGFCHDDHNENSLNLLGYAWTLSKEGKSCELVDPCVGESFNLSEVLRSIQVGLLCVQRCQEDRPTMSTVVFMLGNQVELPEAKQPGFFAGRDVGGGRSYSSSNAANSENQLTITWSQGQGR